MSATKIQLASDLHLEHFDIDLKNVTGADVLILSGDILIAQDLHDHSAASIEANTQKPGARQLAAKRFRSFLSRVSGEFSHVIMVAGNHEFYHGKWNQTIDTLKNECAAFANIHFLERSFVTINGVNYIGGTLWTDMNKCDSLTLHAIKDMMNDFKLIRNEEHTYRRLWPVDTVTRHKKTLDYIKHVIADRRDEVFVMVGHHMPHQNSIHPRFKSSTLMNGAYASDLSEFILDHPQIKLVTCGHTHNPHRYYIGDTLVACNPRGYAGENYIENNEWRASRSIDLAQMPSQELVASDWHWEKE